MNVLRLVRDPGRRWPPEESVALRVSAAGSVVLGIAACNAVGELAGWFALGAALLVVVGSVVSHRRRARPIPYLKAALGVSMLVAFSWFLLTVSNYASARDLASVEGPLAVLFAIMQAAHSFDMPSRRDLGFAIAGSATLVAVAATQAVDLSFGIVVVAWAACSVAGMTAAWSSMAGGARVRPGGVAAAVLSTVVIGVALVALLPAPRPTSASTNPFAVALGSASPATEPSHLVRPGSGFGSTHAVASPAGPTGVGGFLGFAGPLDTALRASLGNEVVLRVRADRPTFWLAETFDSWTGRSWTSARPARSGAGPGSPTGGSGRLWDSVPGGPPFLVAPDDLAQGSAYGGTADGRAAQSTGTVGTADYQTFYLTAGSSDLVLHAEYAATLWVPTPRVSVAPDGTIRSATVLGAGSVYSVLSTVSTPTPAQLEGSNGRSGLTSRTLAADLELPHPYPRVAAIARRVTAGVPTVYGKIEALEHWIGAHTRYTLDIPPLRPGQDTVEEFLFGTRRGYCEQISTALTVMLRTLGIPAREAVGYVPGTYDPVTGLYDEQAKDAHAWVQVWFPSYGWQSFDPTASVPLATPSNGPTLAHELVRVVTVLRRLPVLPTAPIGVGVVAAAGAAWWFRRRPRSWRSAVTRDLERAARLARVADDRSETLAALAARLDAALGRDAVAHPDLRAAVPRRAAAPIAVAAELAAWSGREPDEPVARRYVRDARRIRRAAGRRRLARATGFTRPRGARSPRRSSHPPRAAAGTPSAAADATPRGPR